MRLNLEQAAGTGWQAKGVELSIRLDAQHTDRLSLQVSAAQLQFTGLAKPLQGVNIDCPVFQQSAQWIRCQKASLKLGGDLFDQQTATIRFNYNLSDASLEFALTKVAFASGQLSATANTGKNGWQVELNAKQLALDKAQQRLSPLFDLPADTYQASGEATLKLTAHGNDKNQVANISLDVQKAGFSNADGSQVGEGLTLQLNADLTGGGDKAWQGEVSLQHQGGEVFVDPIYLDLTEHELTLNTVFEWSQQQLRLRSVQFVHPAVLFFNAQATFDFSKEFTVKQLQVAANMPDLGRLYHAYLQNWLDSNGDKGLGMTGSISTRVDWGKAIQVRSELSHISLENADKTYGLADLNGRLQWHSDSTNQNYPSFLYWQSAYFAQNLTLGSSEVHFAVRGAQVDLLKPWFIPILDGALQVNSLQLRNLSDMAQLQGEIGSRIWPVSMQALSTAFGGPALQGQLAGNIPSIRYQNGQVEIGGALQINVFDGTINIQSLVLEQPFSNSPRLAADVSLDRINLGTLTGVFEQFGAIQGEVSGYMRQVRLLNWQPVAFDAFVGTTPNSKEPKNISQKAVNNLSSLGGGGTVNAISRSVLNLFDSFSYEKLGWGCRLQNGVCEMRGAATAPNGYYIVKGGGLPSINVIGYNQKVDWPELLIRLKRITQVKDISAPVIE